MFAESQSSKIVCLGLFVVFGLLIHTSSAKPLTERSRLPFEDCGSVYDLKNIKISTCPSIPCRLARGQRVRITADFAAEYDFLHGDKDSAPHVLTHEAKWLINSVYTKVPITPERCEGVNCPSRSNTGFQFEADLRVEVSLPLLPATLHWRVTDKTGKQVICFKTPVAIIK